MSEWTWEEVRKVEDRVVAWRRDIHAHPEAGFQEKRTAGLVVEHLSRLGLSVRGGIGGTGVIADLNVPGAGGRVAMRADMDALEMTDKSGTEYRSTVAGLAHTCGHDAHTAMLLGAATVLSGMKKRLGRSVRFLFQPAEEHPPGGARVMVEAGGMEGVEEVYGLHVDAALETGRFSASVGVAMASTDEFDILVTGKGGHAASPHVSHDPVVASAGVITAVQTLVSRRMDPVEPVVVSICRIEAGTAYNIIPEEVRLSGTIRTLKTETRREVARLLDEVTTGTAAAYGCRATVRVREEYGVTVNDVRAVERVKRVVGRLFPGRPTFQEGQARMGAEDFSHYLQKVPGALVWLGVKNPEKGIVYPHHHPCFDVDESALIQGVAFWVGLALD